MSAHACKNSWIQNLLSILGRNATASSRRRRRSRSLRGSRGASGGSARRTSRSRSDKGSRSLRSRANLRSRRSSRSAARASNTAGRDGNVIVPERVRRGTVRLPAKIHARDFRDKLASGPSIGVGVGDAGTDGQASNGSTVQPCFDGAICAEMVFETLPSARWQVLRSCDALRREIGQSCIVILAIVHHDLRHTAESQVLVCALRGIRHDDESDVLGCQGLGGLP